MITPFITTNILIVYSLYTYKLLKYELFIIIYFRNQKLVLGKIVQALGKYNQEIEEEDRKEIDEWLNKVYIQGWMKLSSETNIVIST